MTTYTVIGHEPPRKPIDLRGRRRVVTMEQVLDNLVREPDPAAYSFDGIGIWRLKE